VGGVGGEGARGGAKVVANYLWRSFMGGVKAGGGSEEEGWG